MGSRFRQAAGVLASSALLLACAGTPTSARAASSQGTSTDVTRPGESSTETVRDSTRQKETVPTAADSFRVTRGSAILAANAAAGGRERASSLDVIATRKFGIASFEDLLRLRRAAFVGAIPLFGPTQGTIALPDGGGTIAVAGSTNDPEHATDEQLVGSFEYGWGAPRLAVALHDPRADALETLDLDSLELASPSPLFTYPGATLTRPVPVGARFRGAVSDTSRTQSARTTLIYRRGSGDAQLTGARFQARAFRRGVYASYSRNQADGWAPLRDTESQHYSLSAELGKLGKRRFALEGSLFQRSIRDSAGLAPFEGGESEWDRREIGIRASREGTRIRDVWRVRAGSGKETWRATDDTNVSPEANLRERWEFPFAAVEGSISLDTGGPLTWTASVSAASRKVVYRVDSLPVFQPRLEEARAHLGTRLALGKGSAFGIDGAYDARENDPGFADVRAYLSHEGPRARGRVDVESAHQRPTWIDLLTPPTTLHFFAPVTFAPSELFRSGDPTLRPRRLTGPIGSLGLTPLRGLDLEITGSYRRVEDDFGWNVSADTTAGTLVVSSVAGPRGSGWLSHAALGWEFRRSALRFRGVGWIRGGPGSLTPHSGSPPRRAVDAALDIRAVLFQGDLPLRFGVETHARGPRSGLIREAGQITWDGTLSADFGTAGAYMRVQDVFDRRPGSAIWDPVFPGGAPLPGRSFQFGVAWNLLD